MGCVGVKKKMRHLFLDRMNEGTMLGSITDPQDIHHLSRVLRLKVHDEVRLAFQGKVYEGRVESLNKNEINFQLLSSVEVEQYPRITLYQALAKGSKLESVLQHGTELGISRFVLVATDHSDITSVEKKKERYLRILKDAAKQSEAPKIPHLSFYHSIEELPFVEKELFFCYEKEERGKIKLEHFQDVGILIGPEGGFSKEEAEYLQTRAKAVTLGRRILRTETAGLIATTLVLHEFGVL